MPLCFIYSHTLPYDPYPEKIKRSGQINRQRYQSLYNTAILVVPQLKVLRFPLRQWYLICQLILSLELIFT